MGRTPKLAHAWIVVVALATIAVMVALAAPRGSAPAAAVATPTAFTPPGAPHGTVRSATPPPTSGATQTRPSPAAPTSTERPPTVNVDGGYWLDGSLRLTPMGAMYGRQCSYDFCAEGVVISTAPLGTPIVLPVGNREVTIGGRSLNEVRTQWRAAVPGASVVDGLLDGEPALDTKSPGGQAYVFAVYGGRLYALRAESLSGDPSPVLHAFMHAFHLIVPSCWMRPCPAWSDVGSDAGAIATFDASRATGTWSQAMPNMGNPIDNATARDWTVKCGETCFGELRIAVGTLGTGALVAPGGPSASSSTEMSVPSTRITGGTLDAIERSWSVQVEAGTFERITLDGVPATRVVDGPYQHVFVVWRGHVIAITSRGWITFDNAPAAPYAAFESSFALIR